MTRMIRGLEAQSDESFSGDEVTQKQTCKLYEFIYLEIINSTGICGRSEGLNECFRLMIDD